MRSLQWSTWVRFLIGMKRVVLELGHLVVKEKQELFSSLTSQAKPYYMFYMSK